MTRPWLIINSANHYYKIAVMLLRHRSLSWQRLVGSTSFVSLDGLASTVFEFAWISTLYLDHRTVCHHFDAGSLLFKGDF